MKHPLFKTGFLGGLALLLIVAGSWFLLLSPRINEPARLALDAESAAMQGESLIQQSQALERYEENLPQAQELASTLGERFTASPDIPYLIEQVQGAAARAQMQVSQVLSVVPAKPTLVVAEPVAPPPAPDPSAAPADPAAAPAADPAAAPVASAEPVPAAPALQTARMDVAITAKGTLPELLSFVTELQTGTRVIVVDSVRMAAAEAVVDPAGVVLEEPGYIASISAHVILIPALVDPDGVGTNQFEGSGDTVLVIPTTEPEPEPTDGPSPTPSGSVLVEVDENGNPIVQVDENGDPMLTDPSATATPTPVDNAMATPTPTPVATVTPTPVATG